MVFLLYNNSSKLSSVYSVDDAAITDFADCLYVYLRFDIVFCQAESIQKGQTT